MLDIAWMKKERRKRAREIWEILSGRCLIDPKTTRNLAMTGNIKWRKMQNVLPERGQTMGRARNSTPKRAEEVKTWKARAKEFSFTERSAKALITAVFDYYNNFIIYGKQVKTIAIKIPGEYSLMPKRSAFSHLAIMSFMNLQNLSAHSDFPFHPRVQCLITHQISHSMIPWP